MNIMRILLLLFCTLLPSISYTQPPNGTYIVVLNPNIAPENVATEVAKKTNGRIGYVYENTIKGFSISVPEVALQAITNNPNVSFVEEDIAMTAFEQTIPTGIQRIFANETSLGINGTDDQRVDVDVAVLDTGIDYDHPDLNVVGGSNCLSYSGRSPWKRTYYCDDTNSSDDDHYHGTHVAGTIGALDNNIGVVGVAPGARLWAVKVLDSSGSGSLAGIIAGIDWVVGHGDIEVINMSLGGTGQSTAMDNAIQTAFENGVFVVVAAGNSNADSANYTPANAPDAFTVSALADYDGLSVPIDTLAYFSNWGDEVNIAAPGVNIYSTYPLERGEYNTISGTSMATPHVAGAAALLASTGKSPLEIKAILEVKTTEGANWFDDSGDGIQEPLLDIGSTIFTPALLAVNNVNENALPTAQFTVNCTDLSCSFDASTSSDSDGSIVSYEWDFGDNQVNTGKTTSHVFGVDGTYTVVLTVTDNEGATASISQEITVSTDSGTPTLVSESINNGSTWSAKVYYSSGGNLSGMWSDGESCSGQELCEKNGLKKKQGSITFTTSDGNMAITIYKP